MKSPPENFKPPKVPRHLFHTPKRLPHFSLTPPSFCSPRPPPPPLHTSLHLVQFLYFDWQVEMVATRELGQNDVKRFPNKVNLYFMTVVTAKLFKGTLGLTVNEGVGRNRLIIIIIIICNYS